MPEKATEKKCALTGKELAGNLQGDDREGLNTLKGKVLECSECLSACPKNEEEMPFKKSYISGRS